MPKPKPDTEMAGRLREARVADGRYPTPSDAARVLSPQATSTYMGHENGSRGFTAEAPRYADFYKVNLEWLVTGKGPMKRFAVAASPRSDDGAEITIPEINIQQLPRDLPILGAGSCGDDGMFEMNGQVSDYARRPPRLAGVKDAYALWVMGTSMYPWRKNGGLVVVHPHLPVNINDFVVVQLKNDTDSASHQAYIKQLVRRTAKEVRLLQFNPHEEKTIPVAKIASIHRILDWDDALGI